MDRRPATLLAAIVAVSATLPTGQVAFAQDVHRCVTADGRINYTDQVCSDIGAVEKNPPAAPAGNVQIHIRDCARSPDDLLFGVRMAIDAQDVNKLAAFYLWTGIGSDQSVPLMDRLDALSQRSLVDLTLMGGDPLATAFINGEEVPRPLPPERLQLLQTRSQDSLETLSTSFHLARSHGCWWLRF